MDLATGREECIELREYGEYAVDTYCMCAYVKARNAAC